MEGDNTMNKTTFMKKVRNYLTTMNPDAKLVMIDYNKEDGTHNTHFLVIDSHAIINKYYISTNIDETEMYVKRYFLDDSTYKHEGEYIEIECPIFN